MEGKLGKSPVLAGVLSGLMPGLGQFYNRQWGKGAGFLIGALAADAAFGASVGFFQLLQNLASGSPPQDAGSILLRSLPLFAVAVWSVVDAARTAKRSC
ncbi:MAG: hypothetical protein HZA21_04565 [Nitrospirae bacterium]|nr:hypothetical protein [Nitrospirota bacterium]